MISNIIYYHKYIIYNRKNIIKNDKIMVFMHCKLNDVFMYSKWSSRLVSHN